MTNRSDLFTRDATGRTPLFHIAERGDIEKVHQMIFSLAGAGMSCQRLALIQIKDSSGLTAADVAEGSGHKEIAELPRGEQMRMEFFE